MKLCIVPSYLAGTNTQDTVLKATVKGIDNE